MLPLLIFAGLIYLATRKKDDSAESGSEKWLAHQKAYPACYDTNMPQVVRDEVSSIFLEPQLGAQHFLAAANYYGKLGYPAASKCLSDYAAALDFLDKSTTPVLAQNSGSDPDGGSLSRTGGTTPGGANASTGLYPGQTGHAPPNQPTTRHPTPSFVPPELSGVCRLDHSIPEEIAGPIRQMLALASTGGVLPSALYQAAALAMGQGWTMAADCLMKAANAAQLTVNTGRRR